jgi:hypothetical protein
MTYSAPEERLEMSERHADSSVESSRGELVDILFGRHYATLVRLGVVMLGSTCGAPWAATHWIMIPHSRTR